MPFCGHATIATAVALAERDGAGPLTSSTRRPGAVPVATSGANGAVTATLTSVVAARRGRARATCSTARSTALGWSADELDPALPPKIGFAGARHLILAAATRERLADLDYDFDGAQGDSCSPTTSRPSTSSTARTRRTFHARNPFPVGGVVEDPATGAAAAAFGAYLRDRA